MGNGENILVVGGAGYIGSFTARALIQRGYQVTVFDNLLAGHREAVPSGAEFVEGDLANDQDLEVLFRNRSFPSIIHFAALTSVADSMREPLSYYRANIAYTVNLLGKALEKGLKKFVFSSTAATYGNPTSALTEEHPQLPINPYGRTKLTIEYLLRDLARTNVLSSVALRYFNACGASEDGSLGEDHTPETHLIPLVMQAALGKSKEVTIFGDDYDTPDGTCVRDYIHVEDLATAHILALESIDSSRETLFRAFNVGTGKGASIREVISATEQVLGRTVPFKMGPRRPGDPGILVAESSKIQKELGWKPQYIEVKEIIKTVNAWMTRHPDGYGK